MKGAHNFEANNMVSVLFERYVEHQPANQEKKEESK